MAGETSALFPELVNLPIVVGIVIHNFPRHLVGGGGGRGGLHQGVHFFNLIALNIVEQCVVAVAENIDYRILAA
jgi:hypothetical protein